MRVEKVCTDFILRLKNGGKDFFSCKKESVDFFDQEKPNNQEFQVLDKLFNLFLLLVEKSKVENRAFSKCLSKCRYVRRFKVAFMFNKMNT